MIGTRQVCAIFAFLLRCTLGGFVIARIMTVVLVMSGMLNLVLGLVRAINR